MECRLWLIPDKQDSAALLPNQHRDGLPARSCLMELLIRRRASSKLTAAHRADNDVKKSVTTCMANDGRNDIYTGQLWAKISWITEHCWTSCWEWEWKTVYSISCMLFRQSSRLSFFGHVGKKKRERKAVIAEDGNNLIAIINLVQVTLSNSIFRGHLSSLESNALKACDWMLLECIRN